jgi:hemerythrin-like domain-containing protein
MIISPIEDLMKEHGLLNRLLLIYEKLNGTSKKEKILFQKTAYIVKTFIHSYHELLEENYIFSTVLKKSKRKEIKRMVKILLRQHKQARKITEKILTTNSLKVMRTCSIKFINMYRVHESREDTEVFPEFNNLVTRKKLHEIGEEFEKSEEEQFGEKGFEKILKDVKRLEKKAGILDLDDV